MCPKQARVISSPVPFLNVCIRVCEHTDPILALAYYLHTKKSNSLFAHFATLLSTVFNSRWKIVLKTLQKVSPPSVFSEGPSHKWHM